MDSCAVDSVNASASTGICWFCRKGRHGDCMRNIPTDGVPEGPHDCTFDTRMVACTCRHGG